MPKKRRTPVTLPPMKNKKEPRWWPIILSACLFIWPLTAILLIRKASYKASYTYKKKKYADYREYTAVIGANYSVTLNEIALVTGRPLSVVKSDIQAMLDQGLLGSQAYIDKRTMTLHIEPEEEDAAPGSSSRVVNEKTKQTADNPHPKTVSETKTEKTAPGSANKTASSLDVSVFETVLNKIRTLNDRIENPGVSAKIDRIGMLTAGIFAIVQMKPERASEVNKFMNYYLPATFKLLETYALMEKQGSQSAAIIESRKKIENILDQLIKAFEKQQDILLKSEFTDVDVDISVLETMMAKDGLVMPRGADINDYRVRGSGI